MSNQYFENNPNLLSDEHEIIYYFKNTTLKFISDAGVFSKGGIDFGSSLLLKSLHIENEVDILDVGCGYGTMGITVAKTNPSVFVDMVDVNLRAINLAKKNAVINNTLNTNIFESNIYENVNKSYDMIITNPPIRAGKKVVHGIVLGGIDYIKNGGSLWCVVQKKQGAESLIKKMKEIYSKVEIISKDKLYFIIKGTKSTN